MSLLLLDKKTFLISLNHKKRFISVQYKELYRYNKSYLIIYWTSFNSKSIVKKISCNLYFINKLSPSHCLYLGSEFLKAEVCLLALQKYILEWLFLKNN
uniref:Conserved hypothetical plastid protein n=1 Tax=Flintiella sanguinaria TaxID=101926 RepID=A0A1X9PUN1_9RHOD|nr:conserved hypothetical plastid protein [Flintiella sanguinaria]